MKTIEEVIKAYEICRQSISPFDEKCEECPYHEEDENGNWLGSYCGDFHFDALHYLKAFRDAKDTLEREKDKYAEAVRNCEEAENKYKKMEEELGAQKLHMMWVDKHFAFDEPNDPLTWQELRQMGGKPVWVETMTSFRSGWYLVRDVFFEDTVYLTDIKRGEGVGRSMDYGKTWQAYRKERS